MAVIKCKMCGGDLVIEAGSTVAECEYCGSKQTIPTQDNEKKLTLFSRANRLRMNSEFDKAFSIYESIVAEFPEEAEAYWGLVLCKYGIEYVDDPATGKKIPTCHRSSFESVMEDSDLEQAVENADVLARRVYREEAKQIEEIRKGILEVSGKEEPYDIFICYKETDENGDRTIDSVIAQDVYDALTDKGYRVFFSRISLEDKLGQEYEPYIFAALNSAKIMLAFGTDYEYYNAVWVKNEWSRYLKLMAKDKNKHLIPCYKNIDAYDMPKEFAKLQAQDMGKVGAVQDLLRGIEKILGGKKEETVPAAAPIQQVVQQVVGGPNVDSLVDRGYMSMEDGAFEEAKKYFDDALNSNSKCAEAYLGLFMAEIQAKNKSQAERTFVAGDYTGNRFYQRAKQFAQGTLQAELSDWEKKRNDRLAKEAEAARRAKEAAEKAERERKAAAERKEREDRYAAAVSAMESHGYAAAIVGFRAVGNFKDSEDNLQKCIEEYRRQLMQRARAESKIDPKIKAVQEKVQYAELAKQQAERELSEAENKKAQAEKREKQISEEIRELSNELSQLHGLFSGGKRRNLESQIETLKSEQVSVASQKRTGDTAISAAKTTLQDAENSLKAAQQELSQAFSEKQKRAAKRWSDEAVIAVAAAEARIAALRKVGSYVTFGTYEQDNNKSNGQEAIEWLVLDVQGNKALLISRYGLDAKPYNTIDEDMIWEKCSLRSWLNEDFLNAAFTPEEQKAILTTNVDNSKSQGYSDWDTNGGNNTQDKIFLLSYAEANKYLNVTRSDRSNTKSRISPTAYAKAQGAGPSDLDKTVDGAAASFWWLRSPGYFQSSAALVFYDGDLFDDRVGESSGCVRPAFWINLESEIF